MPTINTMGKPGKGDSGYKCIIQALNIEFHL